MSWRVASRWYRGDDGAIELGAPAGVDGGWGEALPDDRLADVSMKRETLGCRMSDAGTLLEQLVQEDDEAGHKQWTMIRKHTLAPMSLGSPYMPVIT